MMNTLFLPELREMLAEGDSAGLEEFCTAVHPAATAEFMEGLTAQESWEVLRHTDVATRVEIFNYFPRERQVELLQTLDRREMGRFIGELPPDERVDILEDIEPEIVKELFEHVPVAERQDILRLQSYEDGTAGAWMTTEFARLREDMSIAQVRAQLQKWAETPNALEMLYYLYVVDSEDHLLGVVSFRELALASILYDDQAKKIGDLIERNVISVRVDEPQEEVTRTFARYDLLALPVVDAHNRLIGILTHDDVIDAVREEATENAQRIAAVQPLEDTYLGIALTLLARKRGLWLMILFFASLFTAGALDHYQIFTQQHLWLVMFIPLIISTGGNSGSQSATLVITALTNGDVALTDWRRVLVRESIVGLMLGSFLGLIGLFVAFAVTRNWHHASVIPFTVLGVVLAGTIIGSSLPLICRRMGLDPAIMSNPLVACISDILGIVIYMSIAQLFL